MTGAPRAQRQQLFQGLPFHIQEGGQVRPQLGLQTLKLIVGLAC